MPGLYYRNHYISVFQIPDKSGNSSCIACVEIRHNLEGSPSARLMLNGPFSIAHEASEHGFVMGKRWVDDRLAVNENSAPPRRITPKACADSRFVNARCKSWLASLPARFAYRVSRRFAGADRRL